MDEATKQKLKDAGLEGVITAFDAVAATAKKATDDLAAAAKTIAEKDTIIGQKNDDLVNLRKSTSTEMKKLSEMTETERAAMSEKEIELQKGIEKLAEDNRIFQEGQAASLKKEVDARWDRTATKLAGNNPELKQKILDAGKRIVDSDKAQTEEEIAAIAGTAFNMLGVPKPDSVRTAINGGGGDAGGEIKTGEFADSEAGKSLAGAMNLPAAPVDGGAK